MSINWYKEGFDRLCGSLFFRCLFVTSETEWPRMINRDDGSEEAVVAKVIRDFIDHHSALEKFYLQVKEACADDANFYRLMVEFVTAVCVEMDKHDDSSHDDFSNLWGALFVALRQTETHLGTVISAHSVMVLVALELYHRNNPE